VLPFARYQETRISARSRLRPGKYQISTGIRFFDHMLECSPGTRFRLTLRAEGDLDVDQHHTWKTWASSGAVVSKAWRPQGHHRAATCNAMDETLAVVALDLGGRPRWSTATGEGASGGDCRPSWSGFFGGFVNTQARTCTSACSTAVQPSQIEAVFKCFARAMKYACSRTRAEGPASLHQGLL